MERPSSVEEEWRGSIGTCVSKIEGACGQHA